MTKTKATKGAQSAASGTHPQLSVEAWSQAAECLRVLAHPVRLQIVQLLLQGNYPVGEIAEVCDIAPNIASEHLRLMQRCGFLASTKEGRSVYYQVTEPQLSSIMRCIEKKFEST